MLLILSSDYQLVMDFITVDDQKDMEFYLEKKVELIETKNWALF